MTRQRTKDFIFLALGVLAGSIFIPFSLAMGLSFLGESFTISRDAGLILGTRKAGDADLRWKVISGGNTQQHGDGSGPAFLTWGPIEQNQIPPPNNRVLNEISAGVGVPVGVSFVGKTTGTISVTLEDVPLANPKRGRLLIRDEQGGSNTLLATIAETGMTFPLANGGMGASFP